MSTETPRTQQQHWAEAVAECITDEQEALRIVGFYEDGEWQPEMLAIGRENLALKRDLTAAREQIAELTDKALRFDLDQAGIARREREAVELIDARARVAELEAGLRKTAEALSAITGDFNMTRMMMNDTTTRDLAGEIVKDSRACVDAARALLSPSLEPRT